MTNKELIKKLQGLPPNMEVMLIQTDDESAYNMVNTVEVKAITFGAPDVPRNEWAEVECVVISDEF